MTSTSFDTDLQALPTVTGDEFFRVLALLLAPRRARLPPVRIAFAVVEDGSFHIDTTCATPCGRGGLDDADATVLTNRRTLSDILLDRLAPDHLVPGQLFVWSGPEDVLALLAEALAASSDADERSGATPRP